MRDGWKLGVIGLLGGVALLGWRTGPSIDDLKAAPAYADQAADFRDTSPAPGEIAVDFDDRIDPRTIARWGEKLHTTFRPVSRYAEADRIYVAQIDPARARQALDALRADPAVEAAEENLTFTIPEPVGGPIDGAGPASGRNFPNDPRYPEQWHLDQIHAEKAWPVAQGEGVVVAVVDTGVTRVEDLAGTEFVPGWNFVDNSANTDDDHGHGTHVAGTIAQSTHNDLGVAGVAFRAKLMPVKVLSAQGSGSVAAIADAIRWASDHGAKVENLSLGGALASQLLARAVKYAFDHGTTVVCAAGNDGRGRVSYPAANRGAIAVAATQRDEATAFYSNWGRAIDIAAPGGNTRGDPAGGVLQNTRFQGQDGYFFFMGTSMAAPHVSGVAALLVSQGVTEPAAIEKILEATARTPKVAERPADFALHYGAGIVDAGRAVRRARTEGGLFGLGSALALAWVASGRARRRFGLAGLFSLLCGSSGLFFLADLLPPGRLAAILTHGLPAWDMSLLGPMGHGNPLFYSAFVPLLLVALLLHVRWLGGVLGGLAFGVAGHLFGAAWLHTVDIRLVPFDTLWLGANLIVAAVIGRLTLRGSPG